MAEKEKDKKPAEEQEKKKGTIKYFRESKKIVAE